MSVTTSRTLLSRDERVASILRGAAAAFAGTGFASTSMEDVAAATGVTKLIVYRHFDSKEELYRAVLEQVSRRQRDVFLENLQTAVPTLGLRTFLVVARELPDAFVLLWRHAAREPQFAEYASAFRRRAVEVASVPLAPLVAGRPALATWAPQAMLDVMVAEVLAWMQHGSPEHDDEFLESASRGLWAMLDAWRG